MSIKRKPNHTTRNVRHAKAVSMRELDKLAREVMLRRDHERCCYCNLSLCEGRLDPHHIEHRGNKNTKYLLDNLIAMCRKHHSELNIGESETLFKIWFIHTFPLRWQAIQAAARTISPLRGKPYADFWYEYLLT
ncbi:MAG: HNH endonuclease [Patescibacteria group bacterium]|nr:HNH endonuclease [Patescibacteria group bacterium]